MQTLFLVISVLVSSVVTAVLGKKLIPFLHKLKFGQTIREVGPAWHKNKQGTPTMGGIMFIVGIVVAFAISFTLKQSFGSVESNLATIKVLAGLGMALAYGVVGFLDDYISIKKKRNLGLTEIQKLVFQFAIAGAYLLTVYLAGGTSVTYIPFVGGIDLGIFYYIIAALIIVGMVNAVNLSDGVDGVCSCETFVVSVCFIILTALTGAFETNAILAASVAGACLGFLVWNFNPAKVFMGDTGSLFLGGIVCAYAFAMNMPVLLLPVGIIYIIEILSVVLQVSYFKITKGKRIFKMSPIHHHYEMCGWSEVKICTVFSIITAIGSAVAIVLVVFG